MKFRQPWQVEVTPWTEPMAYEEWEQAVCRGMTGDRIALRQYHAAQWDAADCREFLMIHKRLKAPKPVKPPKPAREPKPPKSRVVTLDVPAVKRRIARCVWRECGKLLLRRMTPEARQMINEMQARMWAQCGFEGDDE